jgi:hypothetical protein
MLNDMLSYWLKFYILAVDLFVFVEDSGSE